MPDGTTVRLDPRVWRVDGGRTLVGGSPPRVLHLSGAAREHLGGGELVVRDATTAALARLLTDAGVAHPDPHAPPAGGPRVADVVVVVPVRDRPAGLDRLLGALAGSAPAGTAVAGVVVVDDGSADPGVLAAVAAAHGAAAVRHERSRGPAAARNSGARWVTDHHRAATVLAFLDSDVVPEPGWLPPLLGHLADPAVGLVAPRIVAWGHGDGMVARYERRRSSLDLGARPAPVVARSRVAYVPSAALLVRREAFGDGFREDMPVAEDVDLVWRLVAAGRRARYEPAARVAHEHRDTLGPWLARRAFYGTGAAALARAHPGAAPPVALAPWTAAVVVLLGVQRRWSWAAAAVLTAVATERLARGLGRVRHPRRLAVRLAPRGLAGAAEQAAGVLTRHAWPLVLPAAVAGRRVRRLLVAAAVVEGLVDWVRVREPGAGAGDAVAHVVAHRLDDLAYGAGLWWGAWRARSVAALRPDLRGSGPGR